MPLSNSCCFLMARVPDLTFFSSDFDSEPDFRSALSHLFSSLFTVFISVFISFFSLSWFVFCTVPCCLPPAWSSLLFKTRWFLIYVYLCLLNLPPSNLTLFPSRQMSWPRNLMILLSRLPSFCSSLFFKTKWFLMDSFYLILHLSPLPVFSSRAS